VLASFDTSPLERYRAVNSLEPAGVTPLYNALLWVLDYSGSGVGGFRSVVVFTDGDDQHSSATSDMVLERLRVTAASVSMLLFEGGRVSNDAKQALDNIADESGGRLERVTNRDSLDRALERIYNDLSSTYSCVFSPAGEPDGRRHTLSVEIPSRSNVRINSRQWYLSDKGGNQSTATWSTSPQR
jgi:hypothetical protein